VLPASDTEALERTLAEEKDVAAVIMEATGASMGTIPLAPGFLAAVRRLTQAYHTLLILDEVVTGFRYSPGGVQAAAGVVPDVTILAKILAGGLRMHGEREVEETAAGFARSLDMMIAEGILKRARS